MIVNNDETVLARCLNSIKQAVDEIIILDTGSVDKTKSIAFAYTDKVYNFRWTNDFSAARNYARSKAAMDYLMWLDADDLIPEDTLGKLVELKEKLPEDVRMVTVKCVPQFGKGKDFVTIAARELPDVYYGPVPKGEGDYGGSEPDMPLSAKQQFDCARDLFDREQWVESAYYFEQFMGSGMGQGEDKIAACFYLSICYRMSGERDKILPVLAKSFGFDVPRAEICTQIGYYYKNALDYSAALKWFLTAANLPKQNAKGFLLLDYWGYIPNMEASICAGKLGDYAGAEIYKNRAAALKPYMNGSEISPELLTPLPSPREPGKRNNVRVVSYDEEFKKRAMQFYDNGHSMAETASVYKIGLSTIKRWKKKR